MNKNLSEIFLELGSSKIILSFNDELHNKIITEEKNILNDEKNNNLLLDAERNKIENSILFKNKNQFKFGVWAK